MKSDVATSQIRVRQHTQLEEPVAQVVVAGHLMVDPDERRGYLAGCVEVIRQARTAAGCLDFAIGPDLLEPGRINIHERWASQAAVDVFRGGGPSNEQGAEILGATVAEFDVVAERSLM